MCKLWKNWTRFFNLCHRMLDVYWKSLLSIPPWMRCHGRANPPAFLLGFPNSQPVPTYTSGWRETMWSEVSYLRKQHDAMQRPSLEARPPQTLWSRKSSDQKSQAMTTTLPRLHVPYLYPALAKVFSVEWRGVQAKMRRAKVEQFWNIC